MNRDWRAYGDACRAERSRRRWSQAYIALLIGVSRTTITRIEGSLGGAASGETLAALERLLPGLAKVGLLADGKDTPDA